MQTIIIAVVVSFLAIKIHFWWRIRSLRRQGIYPPAGQVTMADVERLSKTGYRVEAIRCYRELNPQLGLAEAKAAVEALKQS
ncbi:MAG TPA: hypothetical protein VGH19_14760 [Verrucomicrobiae bacterium]